MHCMNNKSDRSQLGRDFKAVSCLHTQVVHGYWSEQVVEREVNMGADIDSPRIPAMVKLEGIGCFLPALLEEWFT